ncbi:putative inactive protein RESTRICTED TEV MOVEMENT 2-like isoform [Sesbania bispinosa]|nr:putative inactive protein RESTRICTED TEV MOVEMENT 2-like isoform [Sesbania bispinosa]
MVLPREQIGAKVEYDFGRGSDHKEGLPPQPAARDDREKTTASEVKDQKGQEGPSDQDPKSKVEGKEDAGHETSTPTRSHKRAFASKG